MQIYNITFYNDMGNLMTNPGFNYLPKAIYDFVYSKANMYLLDATDNNGKNCRFYILKPGLSNNWTYFYNNYKINIFYNVDTFNPKTMKYI